jgi:phosphoribosylanthranilate isomerase
MTCVKICGCRSVEEALAARDAGAEFIGLVFADSPRRVSPETARQISDALRTEPLDGTASPSRSPTQLDRLLATKRPLVVGVFEGQSAPEVRSIAARAKLDVIQLHGGTPLDDLSMRLPMIRAVENVGNVNTHVRESTVCLLDGSRGRGRLGDWDALGAVASKTPVILAGGLTPENVADAIRRVRPWGVDVSSGVETAGRKDATKIRAFVAAAKGATWQ